MENLRLHHQTVETIQSRLGEKGSLYQHQTDALRLVLAGQNALIATGTSSGKTLCYQIPILDDLARYSLPGLCAVIIYPLNALVNDQLFRMGTNSTRTSRHYLRAFHRPNTSHAGRIRNTVAKTNGARVERAGYGIERV